MHASNQRPGVLIPHSGSVRRRSLPELAQYAGEIGRVGGGELAEGPLGVGTARRLDGVRETSPVIGYLHEDGAPIAGI
jgi:hypothetical protein